MIAIAPSGSMAGELRSWSPAGRGAGAAPAARGRSDLRVYRRRRAVALLVFTIAAVTLAVGLRSALAGHGDGALTTTVSSGAWRSEPIAVRVYIVQPGDTLWSIVRRRGIAGDPRPVVDRLASQLGGRQLQIGQRLVLP